MQTALTYFYNNNFPRIQVVCKTRQPRLFVNYKTDI